MDPKELKKYIYVIEYHQRIIQENIQFLHLTCPEEIQERFINNIQKVSNTLMEVLADMRKDMKKQKIYN